MPSLKPHGQEIQILHHCSVSWKITSLYFFNWNLLYSGEKEPNEVKFSDFWVVGWKFTKFPMSYLKSKVSFSLKFAILFSVMREIVQNFRLLTAHVKFHQMCTLIGSFCWKYIQCQLQSTEELCFMTLKSDAKFEEKRFRNDKNLVNFDPALESLQNLHFDLSLLCKVYNVWP